MNMEKSSLEESPCSFSCSI